MSDSKLSKELRQLHDSGDVGMAVEGFPEQAEALEQIIEQLQQQNIELQDSVIIWKNVATDLTEYRDKIKKERDQLAATVERYEQAITDASAAFNSQYHIGNDQIAVQMSEALDIDMDESYESILNTVRREAVLKLHFPTMLRKMWSGTEVQNWLIEQANTKYPNKD